MASRETKVESFFNGQVLARFSKGSHQYFIKCPEGKVEVDGKVISYPDRKNKFVKVISTTQVTKPTLNKPNLLNWAVNTCVRSAVKLFSEGTSKEEAIKEGKKASFKQMIKGGKIGTEVHEHIQGLVLNEVPSSPSCKEVSNCISAWGVFKAEHPELEVLGSELLVYNPILDVAGTIDLLFKYKGLTGVLDFKTSPYIYPDNLMQIANYRESVRLLGVNPKISWILRLDKKNGSYDLEDRSKHHEDDYGAFMCAHFLNGWLKSTP